MEKVTVCVTLETPAVATLGHIGAVTGTLPWERSQTNGNPITRGARLENTPVAALVILDAQRATVGSSVGEGFLGEMPQNSDIMSRNFLPEARLR